MTVGLFGKLARNVPAKPEECVLVFLNADPLPEEFWTLQDKLYEVMDHSNVGEFDGNEIGEGTATLFFYGADANKLVQIVEPVLKQYPMCRDARVVLRKGKPGSPQTEFKL